MVQFSAEAIDTSPQSIQTGSGTNKPPL